MKAANLPDSSLAPPASRSTAATPGPKNIAATSLSAKSPAISFIALTWSRKGSAFTATRADPDAEFLASTDNWFRPVQFANAPDGTLYMIDMYRELIEGAAFLPPADIEAHGCQRPASNAARIYRIVPDGFKQPKLPQLGKATTAELVELLAHSNGWHRDTASRLLFQRQDRDAIEPLKKLATESRDALGRLACARRTEGAQ